jgi:transcriptional regulator with XRE-family HTH domain
VYRLEQLRLPTVVDPKLLVPSHQRFRFLKALSRADRWMHRPELVARAAAGMNKDTANSLLRTLVLDGYVETRADTNRAHVGRPWSVWRILAHSRRTVAIIAPHAQQLYRRALPRTVDVEILYLLQAFPQGLFGHQIIQALRRRRSRHGAKNRLKLAPGQGYIERTTLADNVDFPVGEHKHRFYRLTPEGHRWAEVLQELTAVRFPDRTRREGEGAGRPKIPIDEGDVPVTDPFTEEVTAEGLATAEALALAPPPSIDHLLFEFRKNGRLAYRGPALSDEAVLGMGLGLAAQRLRVKAGLSQEEFAELAGLRLPYVILLETGKQMPPPGKWMRFAQILGTTSLALLELAVQIIEDELPMLAFTKSASKSGGTYRGVRQRAIFSKRRARLLSGLVRTTSKKVA